GKIGVGPPFGEEFGGAHSRQLLSDGGGDELIDADAILLREPFDFRLDGTRQPQRVGALPLHVLTLRSASAGLNISIPNRVGAAPKSRRLKVTMASARPFIAASRTSSSAGSRNCGRQRKCGSTGSAIASTTSMNTSASATLSPRQRDVPQV